MEDAVAHPVAIRNANAELLHRADIASAVQRTHHWSPLKELPSLGSDYMVSGVPFGLFGDNHKISLFLQIEEN